jgi:hypothetical protein
MVCLPIRCRVTPTANLTNCGREGGVAEYKQDLLEKSRYQAQFEEFLLASSNRPDSDPIQPVVDESAVRYWSDYNQVDYHPRSLQKLPDLFDWESGTGDWVAGKETFDRYNRQVNISPEGRRGYV